MSDDLLATPGDVATPAEIPSREWGDIAARVRARIKEHNVSLLAAGIAFYTLLAAVPALVAVISIYALVANPADVSSQVLSSLSAAPREVRDLVTAGAVLAAALWIAGSVLFSVYTANFAKYNQTYGSLGAVVITMLWLFLTAAAIIVGAELNAELERRTERANPVLRSPS